MVATLSASFATGRPPKVSVIVPVYNCEASLTKCLNSLVSQSLKEIQIVCVDDASSDKSGEVLASFAKEDERILLLSHEQNRGVSAARNTALAFARGEIIAFCDADDSLSLNACEVVVKSFDDWADIVVFGGEVEGEVSLAKSGFQGFLRRIFYRKKPSFMQKALQCEDKTLTQINLKTLFNTTSLLPLIGNKAFKREFLQRQNARFDEELSVGEDLLFLTPLFLQSRKTALVSQKLYRYNYQPKEIPQELKAKNHLLVVKKLHNNLQEAAKSEAERGEVANFYLSYAGKELLKPNLKHLAAEFLLLFESLEVQITKTSRKKILAKLRELSA